MRWRVALRGVIAAILAVCLGAFLAACLCASARAQLTDDWDDDADDERAGSDMAPDIPVGPDLLWGGSQPEHFLFYAGYDAWRHGRAAYSGLHWAPNTLNEDGFVLRLLLSNSIEHYRSGIQSNRTDILRASLLPGWRWSRNGVEIKLFGGLDVEGWQATPFDPWGSSLNGTHVGARGLVEVWWEPRPGFMVTASATATTIGNAASGRIAAGFRLFDMAWLGPELLASTDQFSDQYRAGAHLTGLRMMPWEGAPLLEWSTALGYLEDSYSRSGVYARIGLLARR